MGVRGVLGVCVSQRDFEICDGKRVREIELVTNVSNISKVRERERVRVSEKVRVACQ